MKLSCFFALLLVTFFSNSTRAENSRCIEHPASEYDPGTLICSYKTLDLPAKKGEAKREVKYQIPLGETPKGGWPVVVLYQGSYFPVTFQSKADAYFGGYYRTKTIKTLLDNGYAVLAPMALNGVAWQTNVLSPSQKYTNTSDYAFLSNLIKGIEAGTFGPLNHKRKYATGMSSGGYNTSRMAVSFEGEFKALVIDSGSYAYCMGPYCVVPTLPKSHPPTFFIQGKYDQIVPLWTMEMYLNKLKKTGITADAYVNQTGYHEWFPKSPELTLKWFNCFDKPMEYSC